ncbi:MAG: hypothetical protein AAB802_04615 [Patescibacteria group bacterium]
MNKKLLAFLSLAFLMSACSQTPPNVAESRPGTDSAPVEVEESTSIDDWTSYKNEVYGFSLNVPSAWDITEPVGLGDFQVMNGVSNNNGTCDSLDGLGVEVEIRGKEAAKSFEDFANMLNEGNFFGANHGELTALEINGKKAFRSQSSGMASDCEFFGYLIEGDADTYARLYLWGSEQHPEFEKLDTIVQSVELF